MKNRHFLTAPILVGSVLLGGCAIPAYDVPLDEFGQPTVRTIVERIQCEIRDMVRDDRKGDPSSFHRPFLLNGDYDVLVALSLQVTDSGGLSPSLSYITPLATGTTFTFGANAALSQTRGHTFTENIQLSTRQIYNEWKAGRAYECPPANTNLAGSLGLKDIVSMAASTPDLADEGTGKTVFGGTIQFVVTKSVSATGPSWQLVRFRNLAALANLSEINTDSITLSFAPGTNKGKRLVPIRGFNPVGYQFLQQQLLSSISSQLVIQNTAR